MIYVILGIAACILLPLLSWATTPEKVEKPCQCDHCTSYLNKRSYCTAPRGHGHIQAGYIPLTILEGLRLRPMGPEPGPLTFLRYKHPLIRRVNMREVGEKIAAVQSLERKPCTNS